MIDVVLAPIGFLAAISGSTVSLLMPLLLLSLLARFAHERKQAIDRAMELGRAYRGTAYLLGDVIEADDAYTGAHSRDVVELSLAVGDRLGLGSRERQAVELVALLHDVGKIKLPNEIIRKQGPLTADERALIERHTVEGEQLLLKVGGLLGEVGAMVRSCHERWDGKGYPDRLAGEAIPRVARIICCCDAFNAMTTDRSYRKGRSVGAAAAELRRCSGTHFDPAVVEALLSVIGFSHPDE
jgi:HD-GYP domain-containing protein (c-di-GMP phosphodiesterase class II)